MFLSLRGRLLHDTDIAESYYLEKGRTRVAPSLLATAPLLQAHEEVGDAMDGAEFDLRWKVALEIEIEIALSPSAPFRYSSAVNPARKVREVLEHSPSLGWEGGYLMPGPRVPVALATRYIPGRGAVNDTHNVLADGIVKLMRAMGKLEEIPLRPWVQAHGYRRYLGGSTKDEAAIDWSDRRARRQLLAEIVADADLLLELAR